MTEATAKSMWLDARYLDDHVLLTTTEAWTFLTVPGIGTNLPTREFLNDIIRGVDMVLGGLGDEVELHYHLAYRDIETVSWADRLRRTATNPTPAWDDYVDRMSARMRHLGYKERILYLGVRLGSRRALEKPQLRGARPAQAAKAWLDALASAASGPDPQPSSKEVARWRQVASKTRQVLASSMLKASPASANDVAWLIRHIQRLGMPGGLVTGPSRVWGAGTVHSLGEAVTDNTDPTQLTLKLVGRNTNLDRHMAVYRSRLAEATAEGRLPPSKPEAFHETHVAVLPVAQLPEVTSAPWLFHASTEPFPVEVSARMRLITPVQAEKDAAKAAREQRNALQDARNAGVSGHGRDRRRAMGASALHEEIAAGSGVRQVIATYRLIVSGSSREEVGERAEEVIRHYREDDALDVGIEWPPGDQLVLWEELIPGQSRRTKLYEQRQDLLTFAVGLPFSVSRAGDEEGPYIGSVLTGNPTAVRYDLATAAKRGKVPTVAITGTLGGGKTFLVMELMDHLRMRGYPIIALDPKGDLKGHLLLRGRGNARFFDLSTDGLPGSLDPFNLVPHLVDPADPDRCTPELADAAWRAETRTLVMDVVGQLLHDARNDKMDTVVAMTLDAEMSRPQPTMWHFLEALRLGGVNPPDEARISESTLSDYRMAAIGAHAHLKNASESQLGRLMFAPRDAASTGALFKGGVNTTIVSLSGLDLPKDGRPPSSPSQRFSVALFSLVAHQARQMLQDLDYVGPRALIVDEAHQITALPSGRSMIVSNGRMGRSRDIAMVLVSQAAGDLAGGELRNVISAVFAFRTGSRDERGDIAELLGRDREDEAVHSALPDERAPAGTCLFLDLDRNLVLMRVDRWADEYDVAFDTNPTRQSVSAAGMRIVADQFGVVLDPDAPTPARAVMAPNPRESASPQVPDSSLLSVHVPVVHAAAAPTEPVVAWGSQPAPSMNTPTVHTPVLVLDAPIEDQEGWWAGE